MKTNLIKQKSISQRINDYDWIFIKSNKTEKHDFVPDPIYLIQQFYIPNNKKRSIEIKNCLKKNVKNKLFDKIFLLNEKYYDKDQIGVLPKSVKQIKIGKRLMVSDIFNFIDEYNINGYVVFSNSDIFFDNTLINIKHSNLSNQKKIYSQLRFEYNANKELSACTLNQNGNNTYLKSFSKMTDSSPHKFDSADTWIFHSKFNLHSSAREKLKKYLGYAGIDHVIPKIFYQNGYEIANEPYLIKTYHWHESDHREWNKEDNIKSNRYNEDYLFCVVNNS